MPNESERPPLHDEVAQKLIAALENNSAPWQKRQTPTTQINAATGNAYRGLNQLQLLLQNRTDSRWLTYKQARAAGYAVRHGERGTAIEFWTDKVLQNKLDENGNAIIDANGQPEREFVQLDKPVSRCAMVFNGEQLDGIPAYQKPALTQDPTARAEQILQGLGVAIKHDGSAYYRPNEDIIHLPPVEKFPSAADYYQAALHRAARATGHPSRLNRPTAPLGSLNDAKEELREELAGVFLAAEIGLPRNGRHNATYVEPLIKTLTEHPAEIYRAAKDAEKIRAFLVEREQQLTKGQTVGSETRTPKKEAKRTPEEIKAARELGERSGKHYLIVPYEEKDEARKCGAHWDKDAAAWFVADGQDLAAVAKWEHPRPTKEQPIPALSPREEFARAMTEGGFICGSEHPIMDGKSHRCPTEGDRGGEKSGFYVAHTDGVPNLYAVNNRNPDAVIRRKILGVHTTRAEVSHWREENAAKLAQRAQEQAAGHAKAAAECARKFAAARMPTEPTPYLEKKHVAIHQGVAVDDQQNLLVPFCDVRGEIKTIQNVSVSGKWFEKGGEKTGHFHVIDGFDELKTAPVIVISEGYATAASIKEALNDKAVAVISAGDCHNLKAVAENVHQAFPDKALVIAADDDRDQPNNPGLNHAQEAAAAVGAVIATPYFSAETRAEANAAGVERLSDFNDMERFHSGYAPRDALIAAMDQTLTRLNTEARQERQERQEERQQIRQNERAVEPEAHSAELTR